MATAYGFLAPTLPSTGEEGTYNRHPACFVWIEPGKMLRWIWVLAQNPARPRARLMMDYGTPLTDWQTSVTTTGAARWVFDFLTPPDGHHCAYVETESPTNASCLAQPFLVNTTGARLPDEMQRPWVAMRRFETKTGLPDGWAQIQWRPDTPAPYHPPLRPRDIQPIGAAWHKSYLYVRRITTNTGGSFWRKFVDLPPYGDIGIEAAQKYFYSDTTSHSGFKAGMETPILELTDGPHGVGTYGMVYRLIARNRADGGGWYGMDPSGRLTFQGEAGSRNITTLVGWRTKPGRRRVHGGCFTVLSHLAPAIKAKALEMDLEAHEHIGNWDQVPEPKMFHEPWDMAVAARKAALVGPDNPLGIDLHDGHEFWIADTLNHRILFGDHWTAHAHGRFETAHFPPHGYIQASEPHGKMTMALFSGSANRDAAGNPAPDAFHNEPWGVRIRKRDGKVYATNYAGNNIVRFDIDGRNPELVLQCSINPPDHALRIPKRLHGSSNKMPGFLRGMVLSATATDLSAIPAGTLKINGAAVGDVPAAATASERAKQMVAAINAVSSAARVRASTYSTAQYRFRRDNFVDRQIVVQCSAPALTGVHTQNARSFLLDGPVGEATCVRPQAFEFDSEGNLRWFERYLFTIRKLDFATMTVTTLAELTSDISTNDNADGMLIIDTEGTFWPRDTMAVQTWKNGDYLLAADGTRLPTRLVAGPLRAGRADWCDTPGYNWGEDVWEGRFYAIGSAGGAQSLEITKRLPTDVVRPVAKLQDAITALNWMESPPWLLTHGAGAWEDSLGLPTPEMLAAWGEERAKAYLRNPVHPAVLSPIRGLPETATIPDGRGGMKAIRPVDDVWEWIQHYSQDYDLSGYVDEEDPAVIAELQAQLAAANAALATATDQLSAANTALGEAQAMAANLQAESAAKDDEITRLNGILRSVDDEAKAVAAGAGRIDAAIPDAQPPQP